MSPGAGHGEERYRGPLGATRREHLHQACRCGALHSVEVVVGIDLQADPGLARALFDRGPGFNACVCPRTGEAAPVEAPVVVHDRAGARFALVLPEAWRVRELAERAALLLRLSEDRAHDLPRYVVEFAVVYGGEGLRRFLGEPVDLAVERAAAKTGNGVGADLIDDDVTTAKVPALDPADPVSEVELDVLSEVDLDVVSEVAVDAAADPASSAASDAASEAALDASSDSVETGPWPDVSERVVRRVAADGVVEILIRRERGELAMLDSADLEVRLQLHRMPNYPVATLLLGVPSALRGGEGPAPLWIPLDFAADGDREVLSALGARFEIRLCVREGEGSDLERRLVAPLAANVAGILTAAAEYLKSIPSPQRSFTRGLAGFDAAEYDRLGVGPARAGQVDEAALAALATPAEVMRACALVRRLSQPHAEDWLIMSRGYSIDLWQEQRRQVIARAVEIGIWPGPVAAQIAVTDGLASSRKELVVLLQRNFAAATQGGRRRGAQPGGLDDAAVRDNWRALKAEARALGLPATEWAPPRSQPIASDAEPVASGSIRGVASGAGGRDQPVGRGLASASHAELLAWLGDRARRLAAAIELCRRGEPSAIDPVFTALELMSRVEAGRVLGSVAGFGRAVEPTLLAGLANRKAFLRQGAALALAVMKSEAGVEAVCDLLLEEPTEIWREVARALGETGAAAVMPLAARLGHRPQRARERVAWALAHIAVRDTRRPIETLAAGRDATAAAVARRALELVEEGDDLEPPDEEPTHDQTFNRTFSRRFFESVRAEREAAARGLTSTWVGTSGAGGIGLLGGEGLGIAGSGMAGASGADASIANASRAPAGSAEAELGGANHGEAGDEAASRGAAAVGAGAMTSAAPASRGASVAHGGPAGAESSGASVVGSGSSTEDEARDGGDAGEDSGSAGATPGAGGSSPASESGAGAASDPGNDAEPGPGDTTRSAAGGSGSPGVASDGPGAIESAGIGPGRDMGRNGAGASARAADQGGNGAGEGTSGAGAGSAAADGDAAAPADPPAADADRVESSAGSAADWAGDTAADVTGAAASVPGATEGAAAEAGLRRDETDVAGAEGDGRREPAAERDERELAPN